MGKNRCPWITLDSGPLPRPFKTPPLRRPPTQNKIMLANYQAKVEQRVLQLPMDLDQAEKHSAIADISVISCPKIKNQTSFYDSTRYRGGWRPQLLAGLAALTAHCRCPNETTCDGGEQETKMANIDGHSDMH